MYKKVLIAEDHESANLSVQKAVEDLKICQVDFVFYCDDAYSKIQKAASLGVPYELLITDLSFEEDGIEQQIKNGSQLVEKVKANFPEIKFIVFSAEKKPGIIDFLFNELQINAYVHKGRSDVRELKKAIEQSYINEKYISQENQDAFRQMNAFEFSSYDVKVVTLLSEGILQKNVPEYLQKMNVKPNSLSSVEKRLFTLKDALNVSNNEQLIALFKDLGII
jgi:DNA-binding NarL/FixJ family response regulator